jgi:hypothetical protein
MLYDWLMVPVCNDLNIRNAFDASSVHSSQGSSMLNDHR